MEGVPQQAAMIIRLQTQEEVLIKRCKKGDPVAQREVYDRFAGKMLSVCRRYVKSLEDAEEVLSNVFIKFFERIEQYRGEGSFEGWIKRIAVRESLNYIRYQKNLFVEVEDEHLDYFQHQPVHSSYEVDELMRMIEELPLGYRTVFNLYAIEGYNHQEIADMLEISEGTSKSQLAKARKQLQEKLQQTQYLSRHE